MRAHPSCPDAQADGEVNEFDISGLEAMLAGTLCLMSAYSQGSCAQSPCDRESDARQSHTQQGLIGLKIISNLSCLQYQNSLSPEFRRVLGKLCDSWRQHSLRQMPERELADPAASTPFWHAAPKTVQ
jgi:hypothetical protein